MIENKAEFMTIHDTPKPTRIIRAPYLGKIAGHRNKVLLYDCDDDKTYTGVQLAEIIGITYSTFDRRIRDLTWQSPLVFAPKTKKGYNMDGTPQGYFDTRGNEAWWQLSDKPRNNRLEKIGGGNRPLIERAET